MFRKSSMPLVVAATVAVCALSSALAADPAPAPTSGTTAKKLTKPLPPPATGVVTPEFRPSGLRCGQAAHGPHGSAQAHAGAAGGDEAGPPGHRGEGEEARAPGTPQTAALEKVKTILDGADVQILVILDGTQKEEWERMKEEVKNAGRKSFQTATITK